MKAVVRVSYWIFAACLITSEAAAQWTSVGTGIDYQKFTTAHPNNVFVARMAVANTDAIIGSMIASNRVAGAREIVPGQAARYEDAINYWGESWGRRNDVVVAINGSFFNGTSGVITGGHIYDGWYSKRFDDWGGQTGFVWKMDRSYFNAVCPHFVASEQTVTVGVSSRTFEGINVGRAANQLIVYTPQYNNNTLTTSAGVEVLVEMATPLMLLNPPSVVTGTIRQVRVGQGSTSLPFDHIVLSGEGTAATFLQTYCQPGQQVSISQKLAFYDGPSGSLCSNPDPRTLHKSYALTQGNFEYLKNGVTQPTSDAGMIARNPRTAVAYNSTYVFFMVCDGRSSVSVGMTSTEMAAFCRDILGATYGVNLDGGGSSAMWVNGQVKNVPSDGSQRPVANGLMMVNLQPKITSSVFAAGDTVSTLGAANMRLGPGTDYHAFTTLSAGATGTVLNHSLNGVFAKSYYWWKCSFGSSTGWVAESLLRTSELPPTIIQQPANQSVRPSSSAGFNISASGSIPRYYAWEKNSLRLTDAGHYSGTTTPNLSVNSVDAADEGQYRCVVTNAYGSATSSPALLILVTNVLAAPLTSIPPLAGDTANEARAVTSDGKWIVGASGSRGFLFGTESGSLANVVGSDATQSSIVTGAGNRNVSTQQELVLSGLSSSGHTVWRTANGGTNWSTSVKYASGYVGIPAANGLATTASDKFYSAWTSEGPNANDNWTLFLGLFSNAWPASVAWGQKGAQKPDTLGLNSVSSKGRAVGWRRFQASGLLHANYVADYQGPTTPVMWNFNGLNSSTNLGQAFCVSADGTVVFGTSPKANSGLTNFAYKTVFNSTFPGSATQLSIAALPNFSNTGGSTTLAIPYGCTPDGQFAVGMNFRGSERAVLWDTRDAYPTNWSVTDLTDLAASEGNLDVFSSLTRAYSVGTNGGQLVIAGTGWDTNTVPNRRAFVMKFDPAKVFAVPQPTLSISGSYPAGFTFSFATVARANMIYYLEYATNLIAPYWVVIGSAPANGAVASLPENNPSADRHFYRLRVQ